MLGLLVVTEGGVNPGGGGSFEGSGFGCTNSAENSKSVSRNFHGISRFKYFFFKEKKKFYDPHLQKIVKLQYFLPETDSNLTLSKFANDSMTFEPEATGAAVDVFDDATIADGVADEFEG